MGHEESGVFSSREHWPHIRHSMVCKNGFVRQVYVYGGVVLLGQKIGLRIESFYFLFKSDVLGYSYCTSLIWVRIDCEVEKLLFSLLCQVDSIWIIIRSQKPVVFYPLWANLTSDLWGGSSHLPSARYSTVTFLTAFHISDGWSVSRQAGWPKHYRQHHYKESPGDA